MPFLFRYFTLICLVLVGIAGLPVLLSCGSNQGDSTNGSAASAAAASKPEAGPQPTQQTAEGNIRYPGQGRAQDRRSEVPSAQRQMRHTRAGTSGNHRFACIVKSVRGHG